MRPQRSSHLPVVEPMESREFLSVAPLVNVRPSIGGLVVSPNPVAVGGTIALIASGVADPEGAVGKVEFYRDSNGNGLFEKGIDAQIGLDGSPRKGWNAYWSTAGLPAGTYKFFARTRDALGEVSKPAVATCVIGGKINFVDQYRGVMTLDDGGGTDTTVVTVTNQTAQSYFSGTLVLLNRGIDCTFMATIGRRNTFTATIAGEATGTAQGTFSADGLTLTARFNVVSGGDRFTGTFTVKRP